MITRRRFLNMLMGGSILGSLGAVFYPVIKFLIPPAQTEMEPEAIDFGPQENFAPGASKIMKFGKKPVILVRDNTGSFHALSAKCTHLDCTVQYRKDLDVIWCACHNGKYDLSGRNISGPPPKPLEQLEVNVVKGNVFVRKFV
ncbi:MAG: ubiquinol-cytochrome c reductase iron-sulfur subunit [Chlamydiota bacterium]|nr:ubiquinol-cytochrome c reductase iron-sulfur subunit [Chlamydiota bacterium]